MVWSDAQHHPFWTFKEFYAINFKKLFCSRLYMAYISSPTARHMTHVTPAESPNCLLS